MHGAQEITSPSDPYPGMRSWMAYPATAKCCMACETRLDHVPMRADGYIVCPDCGVEHLPWQVGNPNAAAIMARLYGGI